MRCRVNRDEAWELLCEYTEGEGLRKHGLAVEGIMRPFTLGGRDRRHLTSEA